MKQVFIVAIITLMVLFTHARSNTADRQSVTLIGFANDMEQQILERGPIGKGGEVIVVIGGKGVFSLNESDCTDSSKPERQPIKRLKVFNLHGELFLSREFTGSYTTLSTHMMLPKEIHMVLEVGSCQAETTVVM